ncbi:hypothetical protein CDIK_3458, partial [Cucumispora dikerogammari]
EIFLTITGNSIDNSNVKATGTAISNIKATSNIKILRDTDVGVALLYLLDELSHNGDKCIFYNKEVKVIKLITKREFYSCLVEDELFGVESLLNYYKYIYKMPDINSNIK